jgi:DNA modification methylase
MSLKARSRDTRVRKRFECSVCGNETDAPEGTERLEKRWCRECYGKRKDHRPRELNELSGREWAQASRSVQEYPDTRSVKQRLHGASFPQSLAQQQIEIYTRRGQQVLDPFVGVGTTLDAAAQLGRRGIGIELNPEFAEVARADLEAGGHAKTQRVIIGDACKLDQYVHAESIDFVLTSPPYGALLKNVKGAFPYKWQEHSAIKVLLNPIPYSDRPEDLGNLEYEPFLEQLQVCLRHTWSALREDSYAVWVVKDFRALKEQIPYVNFHGHVIDRAEAAGFTLWDLRIYDQTRFRPLVCLGYPSRNFYTNVGHSYLVVLRKR